MTQLARVFVNNVQEEDTVRRVGGGEFAVSSPYTDRQAAIVLAERLREAAEQLDLQFNGERVSVTVSIGIAVQPQDGTDLQALMMAAEKCLYHAKSAGRNQVYASGGAQ